jgi:hypothetical protein
MMWYLYALWIISVLAALGLATWIGYNWGYTKACKRTLGTEEQIDPKG